MLPATSGCAKCRAVNHLLPFSAKDSPMMHRFLTAASHVALLLALATPASADTPVNVLYSFPSGAQQLPVGGLTQVGSDLYGTTLGQGPGFYGTVYQYPIGASTVNLLHTFSGSDGSNAEGVAAVGSTLYGVTLTGGTASPAAGVVYDLGTDGSNFNVVQNLTTSTGGSPWGPLTAVGSTLYGTTVVGGANGAGTIFSVGTSPSPGFNLLASFPANSSTGGFSSSLIDVSGKLYGTTSGSNGPISSQIFSVNPDGTGYTSLHSVSAVIEFGLTGIGSKLYGLTQFGPGSGEELFSMNLDGTGFTTLHTFSGSGAGTPVGTLAAVGSTLYGVTGSGGANNDGTIFSINADGTGFTTVHSFTETDGQTPRQLTLVGSTLYGVTEAGGASGYGVIFALAPEPSPFVLAITAVPLLALLGRRAMARRTPRCRS